MKHPRFASVFVCALLMSPTLVNAQSIVPAANQDPDQVEQLGFPTTYNVNGIISGYPYSIAWSGRQTDCAAPQAFQANGTGDQFTFSIPGEFDIQAFITYQSVSRPGSVAPPPATVTRHASIAPPALDHINGDAVPTEYAGYVPDGSSPCDGSNMDGQSGRTIEFVVKSNNKTIGPQLGSITAQERITNFFVGGFGQPDGTWRPNNPDSPNAADQKPDNAYTFGQVYEGGNDFAIRDFKVCVVQDQTEEGVISTYTQENRLVWSDAAGGIHTVLISTND